MIKRLVDRWIACLFCDFVFVAEEARTEEKVYFKPHYIADVKG